MSTSAAISVVEEGREIVVEGELQVWSGEPGSVTLSVEGHAGFMGASIPPIASLVTDLAGLRAALDELAPSR